MIIITLNKQDKTDWTVVANGTRYVPGSVDFNVDCHPPVGWNDIDPRVQELSGSLAGERIFTVTIDGQVLLHTDQVPKKVETDSTVSYIWTKH